MASAQQKHEIKSSEGYCSSREPPPSTAVVCYIYDHEIHTNLPHNTSIGCPFVYLYVLIITYQVI